MKEQRLTTSLIPELCCTNIKASLSFYLETLGFRIQYQRDEEGFAMIEREGSCIMLDEVGQNSGIETKRTWISAPMELPFGRGINLQIKTTEIDLLYNRCKQKRSNIFLPIEEKWYRVDNREIGNRQFIVLDPDGYMLRFAQDLGERKI
jgi:catechol 2,3-dioxygenase-like lactoylglutathione lyase family enzyme